LPELTASLHAANELDRCLRSYRETEMARIAAAAAALRDTETSVDKALAKLERFLATLNSLAVEVCLVAYGMFLHRSRIVIIIITSVTVLCLHC